jgi:hypothetical protein
MHNLRNTSYMKEINTVNTGEDIFRLICLTLSDPTSDLSDNVIFKFRSDVERRQTRFLLSLFARCRSLSDAFPRVERTLANR